MLNQSKFTAVSPHFKVQEFVPESVYQTYGDASIRFLDNRVVSLANFARKRFGKATTINNWHSGGALQERAFRVPSSKTGGEMSQHKFGRAVDISVAGMVPREIANDIIQNEQLWLDAGLTTIEDVDFTPTWLHMDIRWTGTNKLLIVKP